MDDISLAIHTAWEKLRPILERDPLELAKRLSRRRAKTLMRPQRAWSLVLRAYRSFDPSAKNLAQLPDPVWGFLWPHLPDMLPNDFEQSIRRIPFYQPLHKSLLRQFRNRSRHAHRSERPASLLPGSSESF